MGQITQSGIVHGIKVGPKHWVIAHNREQIAKEEAENDEGTKRIIANIKAGKRN